MKSYETKNDVFSRFEEITQTYNGFFTENIDFVLKNQLLNKQLFKDIVEVYRNKLDSNRHRWRSEFFGKLMRGACSVYLYTKNKELKSTIDSAVLDMLSVEDELGRFSSYSVKEEFNGWDIWGRKYVLLGFEYFLQISDDKELNKKVVDAMMRHADYILKKIGNKEGQIPMGTTSENWLCLNSFSILEPMVSLYNITKEKRYLDFATYLVNEGCIAGEGDVIKLALEDKVAPFEYPANKAYELMSCFEGLSEYYRIVKDEKYLLALQNFVDKLIATDITVIGCGGTMHEQFNNSKAKQTDDSYNGLMQETCVTVTYMKLCYQLYRLTGNGKYADEIERSAYNALLGAVNTEKAKNNFGFTFDSYTDLINGHRARENGGLMILNYNENGPFPGLIDLPKDAKLFGCCTAISALGLGLFVSYSFMETKKGVAVSEYFDGKTVLPFASFDVKTNYPYQNSVAMSICADKEFELMLRIPSFSSEKYEVKLNGEIYNLKIENGFIVVNIKKGNSNISLSFDDEIKVILPYSLFGKGKYKALKKGAILLAEDERLGYSTLDNIKLDFDKNFVLQNYKQTNAEIKNNFAYEIDGKTLIDFASSGKEWESEKRYAVWLLSKD